MNIFISYKQSGIPEEELKTNLSIIRNELDKLGYKTFIYYFDEDSQREAEYILEKAKEAIIKSDLVIAYINHEEKSEGMLLELGIAYSLGKDIKLFMNEKISENNFYLSRGLTKDIIIFKNIDEIRKILD